jgi:hypothetical protein
MIEAGGEIRAYFPPKRGVMRITVGGDHPSRLYQLETGNASGVLGGMVQR